MSWDSLTEDILEDFAGYSGAIGRLERDSYSVIVRNPRDEKRTQSERERLVRARYAANAGFRARRIAASTKWAAANREHINAHRKARYAADAQYRARRIASTRRAQLARGVK